MRPLHGVAQGAVHRTLTHECDQLARVLDAMQDKRDVEDLVDGLLDEDVDE